MGARRKTALFVALLVASAAVAGCTNVDAADQRVVDHLSTLAVLAAPPGSTQLSYTEHKGGGNDLIRNSSSITAVYASPQEPIELSRYYMGRFKAEWDFRDRGINGLGGWDTLGGLAGEPGTTARIEVRLPAASDASPEGTSSIVTVRVAATRPA